MTGTIQVFAGKLLDMARQPGGTRLGDLVATTRGWGGAMAYPESCTCGRATVTALSQHCHSITASVTHSIAALSQHCHSITALSQHCHSIAALSQHCHSIAALFAGLC